MAPTADAAAMAKQLRKLGFAQDQVVQEFGYDEDIDFVVRDAIEELIGSDLVDEEHDDVVDVALLWFRADDGDLTDAVVDCLTDLEDDGFVVLLTPKAGRPGHVEPSDVGEAATTAGLNVSGNLAGCPDWSGTRLVSPRHARK